MAELALLGGQPEVNEKIGSHLWPMYEASEKEALMDVLESRSWYYGEKCRAFEETFAAFQTAKYGIACTGGTVALEAICRAAGIGVGDEVITSAYTFIGTCTAILKAGATVIFADIDPDTNNIDPDALEALITPRTKAIMPVHYGGLACDMNRLQTLADRHNLVILEDACHGWGAQYEGKGLGSLGLASGFSFQQSKNMTGGDGGIALTNDEAIADAIGCAINTGRSRFDASDERMRWGGNHRMTEFVAAILLCQLKRLPEHVEIREQNATMLSRTLSGLDGIDPIHRLPEATRVSWHVFGARYFPEAFEGVPREVFVKAMCAEGVNLSTGYPEPVYKQPVFQQDWANSDYKPFVWSEGAQDYRSLHLPKVEQYCKERLSIRQTDLLATESQMNSVTRAFTKVRENADKLKVWADHQSPAV
jgi:dTDP-4-amino-4,6-dideoxygalactose transaminase